MPVTPDGIPETHWGASRILQLEREVAELRERILTNQHRILELSEQAPNVLEVVEGILGWEP